MLGIDFPVGGPCCVQWNGSSLQEQKLWPGIFITIGSLPFFRGIGMFHYHTIFSIIYSSEEYFYLKTEVKVAWN